MNRLLAILLLMVRALPLCLLVPLQAQAAPHIIVVTATYPRNDGVTPAAGTVEFQLSVPLADATTKQTFAATSQTAILDGAGHISINLVASNDPELLPTGGTYTVTARINGKVDTYKTVIPYNAAGGTIDLSILSPSSPQLVYGNPPANMVTTNTDQTITGLKTFQHQVGDTVQLTLDASFYNRDMLVVKRWNGPNPGDPPAAGPFWVNGLKIGSQGNIETNAWINASAVMDGTYDASGQPNHAQGDPFTPNNIGCYSDVLGPCLSLRPANGANVRALAAMNHSGGYTVGIADAPRLEFGNGASGSYAAYTTAWDTYLERTAAGALHVNASLKADAYIQPQAIISTTPSISPACTSAVAGGIVYVDKSNDGAVSHMCFCGTAADDSTYGWRRVDAPATACP
jgi:hypothetical protein